MPRKIEKPTGRLTLRVPLEMHVELARVASALKLDVNGLINTMLREHIADYSYKADEIEHPRMMAVLLGEMVAKGDKGDRVAFKIGQLHDGKKMPIAELLALTKLDQKTVTAFVDRYREMIADIDASETPETKKAKRQAAKKLSEQMGKWRLK